MEPKNSKIFNREIMQTVSAFCESEEIKDVDQFMYLCFKQGFDIKRYGFLGKTLDEGEKDLIKEVIVEKRVEVPVEIIKEVEIVKEIPVEKEVIKEVVKEVIVEVPVEKVVVREVIKEIPVDRVIEKEVYITDDTQVNELLLKIQQLENKMSKKNEELDEVRQKFSTKDTENESFFQNEMSKKNEEIDELRQTLDELRRNDKLKLLQETLQNLRNELQQKNEQIKELEKINRELLSGNQNQAYLLRGSNLNRRI